MRTFAPKQNPIQEGKSARPGWAFSKQGREVNLSPNSHRSIGNSTVERPLQAHTQGLGNESRTTALPQFGHNFSRIPVHADARATIQPKLKVNTPGDALEQQAEGVAGQVMRMPGPQLQRTRAGGGETPGRSNEQDAHERLQTKPVQANDSWEIEAPPIVNEVLHSSGQPLDPSTREFMEPRFGHDFSQVRVHTDAQAAESAGAIDALAYTVGRDVVFGAGQYHPEMTVGKRLLAHELTHTVQQKDSHLIQRQSIKPEGGAAPYVPKEDDLNKDMLAKSADERKKFIEDFVSEFYPKWEQLKNEGYWDKLKNIGNLAKSETITNRIEPVPESDSLVNSKSKVKTRYADPATRFSIGDDPKAGEDILDEQFKKNKKEIKEEDYSDINNQSIIINQYAKDGGQTTAAIMSLRNIQTVVNRFYAAYLASKEAGMDYSLSETLAVYQQEGNKEMPPSSKSLQSNIPTGVNDSVTSVGYYPDRIEISSGVLILNPDFFLPDKKVVIKTMSEERLRFFALRLYVNHIGGLDVIHQYNSVTELAKWSLKNLTELNKVKNTSDNPKAEADALAAAEVKWKRMRDDLQITKKPKAYIITPSDPVEFVKDILVETMMYLRRYSDIKRVFGKTDIKESSLPSNMPLSLTYMQFNSSQIKNEKRPKELISSVIKAAKKYKGADRFQSLRLDAALITDPNNFEEIKKWLLGKSPYVSETSSQRWQLVMDFIEHAGYEDWKNNWAQMRGNASLVRTQSEFYKIVFE